MPPAALASARRAPLDLELCQPAAGIQTPSSCCAAYPRPGRRGGQPAGQRRLVLGEGSSVRRLPAAPYLGSAEGTLAGRLSRSRRPPGQASPRPGLPRVKRGGCSRAVGESCEGPDPAKESQLDAPSRCCAGATRLPSRQPPPSWERRSLRHAPLGPVPEMAGKAQAQAQAGEGAAAAASGTPGALALQRGQAGGRAADGTLPQRQSPAAPGQRPCCVTETHRRASRAAPATPLPPPLPTPPPPASSGGASWIPACTPQPATSPSVTRPGCRGEGKTTKLEAAALGAPC